MQTIFFGFQRPVARFPVASALRSGNQPTSVLPLIPSRDVVELRFAGTPTVDIDRQATEFSREWGDRLEQETVAASLAKWELAIQAPQASEERFQALERQALDTRYNTQAYNQLTMLLEHRAKIKNPAVLKHLETLKEEGYIKPNADDSEVIALETKQSARGLQLHQMLGTFDLFRMGLNGWDTPVAGQRKSFAEQVLDFMRENNALAKLQNVDNYLDLRLKKQGLTDAQLDKALKQSMRKLDDVSDIIERRGAIWKAGWPNFGDDFIGKARKTARLIGQSQRLENVLAKSDLHADPARPGKIKHTITAPIKLPYDVRVLANLPNAPDFGEFLHETIGHGITLQMPDSNLPPQLRKSDLITDEGVGVLVQQQGYNEKFWTEIMGKRLDKPFRKALAYRHLVELMEGLRFIVQQTQIERALYKNPDQDTKALNEKWVCWRERKPFPDEDERYNEWASQPNFLFMPGNYFSYLYAQAWGAQLEEAMKAKHGNFLTPEAWQDLEKVLSQGKMNDWQQQIKMLTGKEFSFDALFKQMDDLIKILDS